MPELLKLLTTEVNELIKFIFPIDINTTKLKNKITNRIKISS